MRISFVVPTYRRPDALRETLQALVSLHYPSDDYEVIVVDDGSEDSTQYGTRASRCTFVYDPSTRLLHNDERVTLPQFCKRQRRGAITVAHLAARNQDPCASLVLLLDNAPISRYDPWSWRLRKVAKTLVASPTVLAAADLLTRRLERQAPESPGLRRIYWSMIGACIFGGIREGLAQRPEVRDVAAGAMRGRFVSA
jgi:hypothetical protein